MPFEHTRRHLPHVARTLAEEFGAHSVLAGDDLAFAALAQLVQRMDGLEMSDATRAMMARSMPKAKAATLVASDSQFIVAQQQGRRCAAPPCVANPSLVEAERFAAEEGYPVAVKRDGFGAGQGVTVCHDAIELRTAIAAEPQHARNATFVVQKYVFGKVYGATVCGLEGRALAGFSFIKHQCTWVNGPTSVARHDRRDDIIANSLELFELYGLNGYAGFDYIVDEAGQAFLLEINPRIMPTGHFGDAFGVDLTAALLASMRNEPLPKPTAPKHEYVALFPNEWARDARSLYLQTAHHDVPWDDPPVLAAMIDHTLVAQTRLERVVFGVS